MKLGNALSAVALVPKPEEFVNFRRYIDPEWLSAALAATGTATIRRRRLPAEQVVWLVIGMALMRDRSIQEVADKLDLALPTPSGSGVASSALVQARARLGEGPLCMLFELCGEHWAHASAKRHPWHGLSVYALDGSTLRVADSEENAKHFGRARGHRGDSAYPMVRLVALMAVRSHLIAAAAFGRYEFSEAAYGEEIWQQIPERSVTVVDRYFLSAGTLIPLARGEERHWLSRAKKSTKWKVTRKLGRGDYLVEMKVRAALRKKDPLLPKTWVARAISYQRKGFKPQRLLTSMLDPEKYPAAEIVSLYHERWEIELAYDEIKTELLEREETIRSRTPDKVNQEIWGILIAFNLVRLEMERIAAEAGVEPIRISFVMSLNLICDEWLWSAVASPGAIPRHLRALRAKVQRFILPPRRSRSNPRAVKIKMSKYAKKRPYGRSRVLK
jgi:hypothetical protein